MKLNFKNSLIILLGILILGGFLRIYKLDNMSLRADEYIGVNISQGHHQSGQWKFWDWNKQELTDKNYTRAKIYYWQTSQVLNFLPPTIFNFRLVSVAWGLLGIALMFFAGYFYSKNFTVALLSAFLWAVSISAITFDRHLRMYSMFAPVYLTLSILIYQFLETLPSKKNNWIEKLSFKTGLNWYYAIPSLFLLIISFATHFLTINIFPVLGVYILTFAIVEWGKNKKLTNKYFKLLLIPFLAFILLGSFGYLKSAFVYIGFFENNFKHFESITMDYSHSLLAITFFILGAIFLMKQEFKKNSWLVLSFSVPFLLAVFVWDRSAGAQYIYLVQTFQTIIIASGIYFIAQKITAVISPSKWYLFFRKTSHKKMLIMGFSVLYIFTILYNFNFYQEPDNFYGEKRKWDRSNYREVFRYYLKHREKDALLVTRNFRNYNYLGANIPVFDFGGEHQPEKELTFDKIKQLESENKTIWIVIDSNDHDYIKGEARHYIRDNYQAIKTTYTNDSMEIWKWIE